jgi:hypothetical protein
MSSDMVVVVALVILAIVGLVYLELNSRRNRKKEGAEEKD